MKRIKFFVAITLGISVLLVCAAVSTKAQITTSGRLTGSVSDSSGALVPKAEVVATKTQTRADFKTTANAEGGWSIPSVPNGTYSIVITAPNFKTMLLTEVKVDAGQVTTANAVL